MSLFNVKPPLKVKEISHHPWERTIKDQHSSKIKYAHNSVNNLTYPKKKEKLHDNDRVKFTIIGNRVTKEFNYCVNLVKGMHTYRSQSFSASIIRGVTGVEWPAVWNDIKIHYGGIAYCLQSQVAVLINDKILGGEKELKELVETKYVYHLTLDYYKEGVKQFANFIKGSGRTCAYLQISADGVEIGTLIFMLYSDIVPYTSENFLRLCKERKSGYGGTPVHRIVKDGWIQCGGFGLKSIEMECENFIIPHDRRGVLCMANADRHVDCSTQFFILLQPAPWMEHKYVAFGQLIDGEQILSKIENIPTWYESPTSEIIIHRAGILNLDCHDIMINKGAKEYIYKHIDDLISLGELLWEELMQKVYVEIEFRNVQCLMKEQQGGEAEAGEEAANNIRATQRFIRKKEDVEKQLQKGQADSRRASSVVSDHGNDEFDVDEYQYEPEEYVYKQVSPSAASVVIKPEKPFYIPLTDVPCPYDVDSTYDLKKFLKGDYCLESDLIHEDKEKKRAVTLENLALSLETFVVKDNESESESTVELDSDDEKEINKYLKTHGDGVSFAGSVIKHIAKTSEKFNIFEGARKSELITDDELRRIRLASGEYRMRERPDHKVSIGVPVTGRLSRGKIMRRQTGFVRPEDLEHIHTIQKSPAYITTEHYDYEDDDDTEGHRKVRIASSTLTATATAPRPARRPTGYVHNDKIDDPERNKSVLNRLYDEMSYSQDSVGPTLKNFKPASETHKNVLLLKYSQNSRMKNLTIEESVKDRHLRHSSIVESFENILNIQYGRKASRKISTDYVNTIDQIEHRIENSIRSVEFAKTRPSMTVSEYQQKNQKYQQLKSNLKSQLKQNTQRNDYGGLRLPGDTPIYSTSDVETYI